MKKEEEFTIRTLMDTAQDLLYEKKYRKTIYTIYREHN